MIEVQLRNLIHNFRNYHDVGKSLQISPNYPTAHSPLINTLALLFAIHNIPKNIQTDRVFDLSP